MAVKLVSVGFPNKKAEYCNFKRRVVCLARLMVHPGFFESKDW